MKIVERIVENHYKPLILEEKKSDLKYMYFIDCFDLIDILKGIKRFTDVSPESPKRKFGLTSLAYGLILDGWIDQVNLLPSHQAEFLDLLDNNFGIRMPHIRQEDITDSVNGSEIENEKWNLKNHSEFKQFIESTVTRSVDIFNLFGLVRENNWQGRLKHMIENSYFKINDYDLKEYIPLIKDENFKKIKIAIEEYRNQQPNEIFKQSRTRNNFNDAIALTHFLSLKGKGVTPIMIDTTGFYRKIVEAAGLNEQFHYKISNKHSPDSQAFPLIRDTAYLVLKSIFDSPAQKKEAIEIQFPEYFDISGDSTSEVRSIKDIVSENGDENLFLADEHELKIKIYEENKKHFVEYLENQFFNKIWLACYRQDNFNDFIKKYFQYQSVDNLNHNATINQYKTLFNENYRNVREKSDLFKALTKIWSDVRETNKITIGADDNAFQALLLFGSFRFSLPFEDNLSEVESILSKILFSDGLLGVEAQRDHAANQTILYLFEGKVNNDLHKLAIGIALLWSMERFRSIIKFFRINYPPNTYLHYSFNLILCASLLKESAIDNRDKVIHMLASLDNKIEINNYQFLIGKSYLYFLIWDSNCPNTFTKTLHVDKKVTSDYFKKAVENISKAIKLLDPKNNNNDHNKMILFVYALNLKIYLIVEGGSDEDLKNILWNIFNFSNYEPANRGLWQGRYHDTLARYYFRFALLHFAINKFQDFETFMGYAVFRITAALKNTFQEKQKAENLEFMINQVNTIYKEQGRKALAEFLKQESTQ